MKVTAFERDNWKCVVCGSDGPLELDHARALMNGGDNTLENLHTLCHDCHVAKTRLDFALRRHRQDLAPETIPPDPEAASETRHAQSPE
ncbi:MAG: HNH endonuclease [Kiritimatiellae bacterium]|nr:HNH endonuclease [Kiritimatiellia bacterium]